MEWKSSSPNFGKWGLRNGKCVKLESILRNTPLSWNINNNNVVSIAGHRWSSVRRNIRTCLFWSTSSLGLNKTKKKKLLKSHYCNNIAVSIVNGWKTYRDYDWWESKENCNNYVDFLLNFPIQIAFTLQYTVICAYV